MERKTTVWMTNLGNCIWLRREKLKIETESLLIAKQNNTIRKNQVKAKIDNMQKNSKCRLSSDKDENVYLIISKWSQLALKEYKRLHD